MFWGFGRAVLVGYNRGSEGRCWCVGLWVRVRWPPMVHHLSGLASKVVKVVGG